MASRRHGLSAVEALEPFSERTHKPQTSSLVESRLRLANALSGRRGSARHVLVTTTTAAAVAAAAVTMT